MAPRFIWSTGLELNTVNVFPSRGGNGISTVTSPKNSGAYAHRTTGGAVGSSWWTTPFLEAGHKEMYASLYFRDGNVANTWTRMEFLTTNGDYIGLYKLLGGGGEFDAIVDGGIVADGTIPLVQAVWTHVEVYVKIDDTNGRIMSRIDGVPDLDYTGDTEPSTDSFIERMRVYEGNTTSYFDDYSIAVGDWCGAIHHAALVPNGDVEGEWSPSTPGTGSNYARIDERPPSDADYNRASGTAYRDKYLLPDWDGLGKQAHFVNLWGRLKKEAIDSTVVKFIVDDGTAEAINTGTFLTESFAYYNKIYNEKPSGGGWAEDDLDAMTIGVESELP